jgi:hypothetical protein
MFTFLGRLLAKAILDNRQLDLPLSDVFLKYMLGQTLTWNDLRTIRPTLAHSLEPLLKVSLEKDRINHDPALVRHC